VLKRTIRAPLPLNRHRWDSFPDEQHLTWEHRSSQEEAQRLGRAPDRGFASKMALRAAPASVKEEIRRLSGVAVLARTE
jgi:hypothetical protein